MWEQEEQASEEVRSLWWTHVDSRLAPAISAEKLVILEKFCVVFREGRKEVLMHMPPLIIGL